MASIDADAQAASSNAAASGTNTANRDRITDLVCTVITIETPNFPVPARLKFLQTISTHEAALKAHMSLQRSGISAKPLILVAENYGVKTANSAQSPQEAA